MSWVDRLRARLRAPVRSTARAVTRLRGDEEARLVFRLPSPRGDGHWLEAACALEVRETEHGEEVHLRTQLRADFERLLRQAPVSESLGRQPKAERLSYRPDDDHGAGTAIPDSASRLPARLRQGMRNAVMRATQRGLQLPPVRRALAPLADQRVESWMELHGSSGPRQHRAGEMLPEALRRLGVEPDPDGPPIQSWEGPVPGGSLHVTTMQLDERHIDQRDADGRPLRISATFAQLNERLPPGRRED